MIEFNDKIKLSDEAAHFYQDIAEENEVNVFDVFEHILEMWALKKLTEEEN